MDQDAPSGQKAPGQGGKVPGGPCPCLSLSLPHLWNGDQSSPVRLPGPWEGPEGADKCVMGEGETESALQFGTQKGQVLNLVLFLS